MEDNFNQVQVFYEIVMAIGGEKDLAKMLHQALAVFLRKLDCSAGGVFLYSRNIYTEDSITTSVSPRTFLATPLYEEISGVIERRMKKKGEKTENSEFSMRFPSEGVDTLIMDVPEVGFIFLNNNIDSFNDELVNALRDPVQKLSEAVIACYQNEDLIRAQFDLELRVARRTQELEARNNELKAAYSELKTAQRQLVHSEKMVSIGQLAAGVAHEVNNPTGFITSNLHTMTEYMAVFKELRLLMDQLIDEVETASSEVCLSIIERIRAIEKQEDLDFILNDSDQLIAESIDGAVRIKEIVSGLRNFARTDDSEAVSADLNHSVEDALRLTWNELKYKCELKKNLGEFPEILCRQDQLTQVFVNILVNAGQAITSQGVITIDTYLENDFTVVRICDNGTGISNENLAKLFDPFFTTKGVGEGTGLGLSISHGIIEKHGGKIEVESIPGEGTCFFVKLPNKNKRKGVNNEAYYCRSSYNLFCLHRL
ncbi:MAG: hypothetical protein JEY99_09530 [Spirochaetales bacterium]|nr:hypothetical protein [Spirochaetales bacterium]